MTGLSRSLDRVKDRYDVIVVGSGYGGGVAASRLARAGKRVAVLERGREVLTGGFPSRFPDLKNELQVTGKRVQTGPSSGALRRAPRRGHARARRLRARRRLADQRRRGAAARRPRVRGRGLARARSRRTACSRKASAAPSAGSARRAIRARPRTRSSRRSRPPEAALGRTPIAPPVTVSLRCDGQSRGRRPARLHALRRLLRGLQRRRQELRRAHLSRRRRAPRRGALHARRRAPRRQGRRRIVDGARAPPG